MEMNRKGIIYALDAALAVSIVIIILVNSSYYFSTASKESLSQLQLVRTGGDIAALLDLTNNFNYAFEQDRETDGDLIPQTSVNLSTYLPKNYAMLMGVTDMKETPTTTPYCPAASGVNTNCETSAGVTCDGTGCTLPTGASIKVKPFTLNSGTPNILTPVKHFVEFGTTRVGQSLAATISVEKSDGNLATTSTIVTFDADTGIYLWGTNDPPIFNSGNVGTTNQITITNNEATPLTITWVRVVGDESYMRFSSTDSTITSRAQIPTDRFVGSGDRIISIIDVNGNFEGYHLVRYWIWLKAAS